VRFEKYGRRVAFGVLLLLSVMAVAPSGRGEQTVGGYNTTMEFMVAEMQKQDTATFADAVLGIWNERNLSNDVFCRIMQADPATFNLWLKGLKETAFNASSDTSYKRLQRWRAEIIDTGGDWLRYYAGCKQLDTQIVNAVRSLTIQRVPNPPPLSDEAVGRRARYWFVQWHNRTKIAWMKVGAPLFDLLLQQPDAFYQVMVFSPLDFQQFVGDLDELCFTNFKDTATAPLETLRLSAISRLQTAGVGNRFTGWNEQVIKRLKSIKVRSIH
jgi:hypothetical protein